MTSDWEFTNCRQAYYTYECKWVIKVELMYYQNTNRFLVAVDLVNKFVLRISATNTPNETTPIWD